MTSELYYTILTLTEELDFQPGGSIRASLKASGLATVATIPDVGLNVLIYKREGLQQMFTSCAKSIMEYIFNTKVPQAKRLAWLKLLLAFADLSGGVLGVDMDSEPQCEPSTTADDSMDDPDDVANYVNSSETEPA
ncbi:hypothetical protein HK102_008631 [Quaeritorhiza haematococci]|nr:hypothetical protein HK102_008631 [Quaeritorhiza haematococci]